MAATRFMNLNLIKVLRFCDETQLEKKVSFLDCFYFLIQRA